MNYKYGKCDDCDCGQEQLIVNKTHNLCNEKNQQRLSKQRGGVKKKSVSRIKGVSQKKRSEGQLYKQACEEIKQERELLCQGCGTSERLSFSHLEPRSYSKRNVANKQMIQIHCMTFGEVEGCHNKYEDHNLSELNDKDQIIEKLKKFAPDYFNLIEDKIK